MVPASKGSHLQRVQKFSRPPAGADSVLIHCTHLGVGGSLTESSCGCTTPDPTLKVWTVISIFITFRTKNRKTPLRLNHKDSSRHSFESLALGSGICTAQSFFAVGEFFFQGWNSCKTMYSLNCFREKEMFTVYSIVENIAQNAFLLEKSSKEI